MNIKRENNTNQTLACPLFPPFRRAAWPILTAGVQAALTKSYTLSFLFSVLDKGSTSPWERGLNENRNGLIRRFFLKGTDFNKLPDYEIIRVKNLLINERPRKILGFKTPKEVFLKELLKKEGDQTLVKVC